MKMHTHFALAGLMLCTSAHAADPRSAVNETALKNGQQNAQFCHHCHDGGSNSARDDVPNLAGQNEAYLFTQMNKFASGQRKNQFMEALIKALTPEERKNIALYFSKQEAASKPAAVANAGQAAAGKKLYNSLCASCHGTNAYGTENVPHLAGQQAGYLRNSLTRYRNGSGERIDPQMAAYTLDLKDSDIVNLAAYLASMR